MNKVVLLIGNLHSNNDEIKRAERYEELKKLNIKIISKHYKRTVKYLSVVLKELVEQLDNNTRILVMHYHDQITDNNKILSYMESNETIVQTPIVIDEQGNISYNDYCLSGLVCSARVLKEYYDRNLVHWKIIINEIQKNCKKDSLILYYDQNRDENIEMKSRTVIAEKNMEVIKTLEKGRVDIAMAFFGMPEEMRQKYSKDRMDVVLKLNELIKKIKNDSR